MVIVIMTNSSWLKSKLDNYDSLTTVLLKQLLTTFEQRNRFKVPYFKFKLFFLVARDSHEGNPRQPIGPLQTRAFGAPMTPWSKQGPFTAPNIGT